jgi:hypothetical protein
MPGAPDLDFEAWELKPEGLPVEASGFSRAKGYGKKGPQLRGVETCHAQNPGGWPIEALIWLSSPKKQASRMPSIIYSRKELPQNLLN